jgi:type III secretory pathway component EscR
MHHHQGVFFVTVFVFVVVVVTQFLAVALVFVLESQVLCCLNHPPSPAFET